MDDLITPAVIDAALKAWFSGNQSESDRGLEASMNLAIDAALHAISASGELVVIGTLPDAELLGKMSAAFAIEPKRDDPEAHYLQRFRNVHRVVTQQARPKVAG